MAATAIGLDIGASAVRVAQVSGGKGGYTLNAFGQVALPQGAVVDGEIRDPGPVSEAISQLWKRAKVRGKKAVIGISNQRVVVRQIDLPYLEEKEFRSSLKFQVAEFIPMSVDDAQLDFIVVDDYTTESQEHMMRVLLVAAATDMVQSFVETASSGGVSPAGVDLVPFAVARAVSAAARGETGMAGSEAIIDVGGSVTNIIIHQNGEPRFVRILLVGGDDATNALAESSSSSYDEAEALKMDLAGGGGTPEERTVLERQVANLVDEIRGSLDYYLSQEDSEPVASVVLTGGGSLTPGLREKLEQTLKTQVSVGTPIAQLGSNKSGLTDDQVAQVEPVSATAIGLAMGGLR